MSYRHPVSLILADIRSAENVGAMFRTADAAGVSDVMLSGYTATPIDRFGRARSDIHKAALGAETWMPWRSFETHDETIAWLRERHIRMVAIEQTTSAVPYRTYTLSGPTALIVGNEVDGVPRPFLEAAATHLMIPMAGKKESLNVSVAAGIVLFGLSDLG